METSFPSLHQLDFNQNVKGEVQITLPEAFPATSDSRYFEEHLLGTYHADLHFNLSFLMSLFCKFCKAIYHGRFFHCLIGLLIGYYRA